MKYDKINKLSKEIGRLKKSSKKADKYKLEKLKAKRDKLEGELEDSIKSNMKESFIDKILKEVSAEIVQGKIPARKVFDLKGNVVPLDQLKGSESQALLAAIKTQLVKTGMIKNFNADNMRNIDIKPFRKNLYVLTPDVGAKKYLYNVTTGQIREA